MMMSNLYFRCLWFIMLCFLVYYSIHVEGAPQVPAMFVFGDSLVDNGNNNYLNSIAKANYFPYGIDLRGPTGRFSNGNTFIDVLGEFLGVPSPPPFADPATSGVKIVGGGDRFTMSQQVINFENSLSQLRTIMSEQDLNSYLSRSITVMVLGSNDYINNYLLPSMYPSSSNYNPSDFANLLLNHYARQLVALYSAGLRKFLVAGIGPLGCIPNQLATAQHDPGRCVDNVNQMMGFFNQGLIKLVDYMNNGTHPGAIFAYGNTYAAIGNILNNPSKYGFIVWDKACCGMGRNQGEMTCMPYATPCFNRNQYIFWDAFHPTQAVNAILAQRAYSGPPSDCYPINIQQMALLSF
ncbi:hypothetical protein Leryth_016569 [Lithospermum erythrorhizon]|nr:hypothetical protein Leryth_016569 [Lithospermum erythrorhizon]